MDKKIKEAFGQVRAEETLKVRTKEFLEQKLERHQRNKKIYRYVVPAAACLLFLLIGANWLYFTPTIEISVDINPSIELGVNRFDRIVSVCGYNEDGEELIEGLYLKNKDYMDAIHQIFDSTKIENLLSQDAVMEIGVIGPEGEQADRILGNLEQCTEQEKNTHCYHAQAEEVEQAHEEGLSYGKYRAYLELQKKNPDISVEEVRNMSMREIHNLLEKTGDEDSDPTYGQQRREQKHKHKHKE